MPTLADQVIDHTVRSAIQKGGAGSGNFGHTGRPGHRGGSSGGGGSKGKKATQERAAEKKKIRTTKQIRNMPEESYKASAERMETWTPSEKPTWYSPMKFLSRTQGDIKGLTKREKVVIERARTISQRNYQENVGKGRKTSPEQSENDTYNQLKKWEQNILHSVAARGEVAAEVGYQATKGLKRKYPNSDLRLSIDKIPRDLQNVDLKVIAQEHRSGLLKTLKKAP